MWVIDMVASRTGAAAPVCDLGDSIPYSHVGVAGHPEPGVQQDDPALRAAIVALTTRRTLPEQAGHIDQVFGVLRLRLAASTVGAGGEIPFDRCPVSHP